MKRNTPAALAFAQARAGDRSVSPALVKAGLSARLATIFGLARRSIARTTGLSPRFGTVKADDVLAAAERIARTCAENVAPDTRPAVEDAVRTAAFLGLNIVYLGADVRAQSRRFRALLRTLAAGEPTARPLPTRMAVRTLSRAVDTAADLRDLLTLDPKSNPIYRRIDAVPEARFWALFDLWPELSGAIGRIWVRASSAFTLPTLTEGERETFDTLLLTSLILFCAEETGSDAEAFGEMVRAATLTFESGVDRVLSVVEVAAAVRRLIPAYAPSPA
jgi:hypothetical protein